MQVDVLPQLVNEQWHPGEEQASEPGVRQSSSLLDAAQPSICAETDEFMAQLGPAPTGKAHAGQQPQQAAAPGQPHSCFCAAHVIAAGAFCRRINTLQRYLEACRELANVPGGARRSPL